MDATFTKVYLIEMEDRLAAGLVSAFERRKEARGRVYTKHSAWSSHAFFAGEQHPREGEGRWPNKAIKPAMLEGSPWRDNFRILPVPLKLAAKPRSLRTSLGWGTIAWTLNKPFFTYAARR
jgi:hypothetical protein